MGSGNARFYVDKCMKKEYEGAREKAEELLLLFWGLAGPGRDAKTENMAYLTQSCQP